VFCLQTADLPVDLNDVFADSTQQTADSRQQTADSRGQTADSRQHTADLLVDLEAVLGEGARVTDLQCVAVCYSV
jgi:hypothetical protein